MLYHQAGCERLGFGNELAGELPLSSVSDQTYRIPLLDVTSSHNSCADMNWTEGSLRRNSRRKGWNQGVFRQREYFAKARAKYQQRAPLDESADRQTTIFIPSYIKDKVAADVSGGRSHGQNDSRMRAMMNDARKRCLPSPTALEDSSSKVPSEDQCGTQAVSYPVGNEKIASSGMADIDTKRRRLLKQSDWAGINFQQTLLEDLAPRSHESIPEHHIRRHGGHLVRKGANVMPLESSRNHRSANRRPNDDMRLRIGTQDLRWSRESNTVKSCEIDVTSSPSSRISSYWKGPSSSRGMPSFAPSTTGKLGSNLAEEESRAHCGTKSPQSLHGSSGEHANQAKQYPVENHNIGAPKYVVNSSPPMHHPRPSRGSLPPVISFKSPDPDASQSLIVRAGSAETPSSSHSPSDNVWREWLQADKLDKGMSNDADYGSASIAAPFTAEASLQVPMEYALMQNTQNQLSSFQPVTSSDAFVACPALCDNLNQQQFALSGTFFSDTCQPSILSLPKTIENPQQHYQDPSFVPSGDEIWQKFLMIGDDISTGGDNPSKDGWTALEGSMQNLMFSPGTGASSVVEAPSSAQDENPAFAHNDNSSDLPSLATCTDSNENGTGPLEDWTDLAHAQACQQQASISGIKQPLGSKFHQPEPFIGRLASKAMPRMGTFKTKIPAQQKRGRGRPKKPRDARRPDIRAWPNFEDDPIDDSSSVKQGSC